MLFKPRNRTRCAAIAQITKTAIALVVAVCFVPAIAHGQGVRYGDVSPLWTTTSTNGINALLTPITNGKINFCSSPANAVPCTNFATTYTDSTLTTACGNSTQVVLAGTTTCVAAADLNGNWGVWVAPGQYAFTVTSGSQSYGPFPVTVGPGVNASGSVQAPIFEQTYNAFDFLGTDPCAKIVAAQNRIPSTGDIINLDSFQGAQSACAAGDLNITKPMTLQTAFSSISINGNMHVTSGNFTLDCATPMAGGLTFVDDGSASGHTLFLDSVSHVVIKNCWLQQSNVTGRTGVYGIVRCQNSSDIQFINDRFGLAPGTNAHTGGSSTAIFTATCSDVVVDQSTADGLQADGFHFTRGSTRIRVSNSEVQYSGDDALSFVGIYTDDGVTFFPPVSDISVSNFHVVSPGGNTGGLSPNSSGFSCVGCSNAHFSNIDIESPAGPAVNISAASGTTPGVSTRYSFNVTVDNVTFNNAALIGTSNAAIRVVNARGISLSKITGYNTGGNGFEIDGVGKDISGDHINLAKIAGRGLFVSQTGSSEPRLLAELYTPYGEAPVTANISNSFFDHIKIVKPTLEAFNLTGESGNHASTIELDNSQAEDLPASQNGALNLWCDQCKFKSDTINGAGNSGLRISTSDRVAVENGSYSNSVVSDGVDCISCTNAKINGITARSNNVVGVFIDNGGSNNVVGGMSDLRGNTTDFCLVQEGTSSCVGNITSNFSGLSNGRILWPNLSGTLGLITENVALRQQLLIADQGNACTNGELALSAGWGTTASVTGVVGTGQTCEWTLTSSGTGQAANPTITDTLTNPLPSASTSCDVRMVGGSGTSTLIDQTTFSATVPAFTFAGTPVAASTYKVVRRCGP